MPLPEMAVVAILLPPATVLVSVVALDETGQALEPRDLFRHEAGWQRFLRQQGHPGT